MFLRSSAGGLAKPGFSDLYLPGPNCTSNCAGHTIYDPSQSSTAQDLGQPFTISYGDNSTVSGEQYSDTVSISGLTVRWILFLGLRCLTI